MATEIPENHAGLKQTIGPWQVLFYGMGSMLGAGIYVLIGNAAGVMGNAVWLAFVASMVAALLTGLSYASVGSRYPKAGGAAYVTQRALRNRRLSYAVGIAVMMSGLTSMAAGLQAIARNVIRLLSGTDAGPWAINAVAIAGALLLGAVIFRGIRESMWANLVCTFVEVGGLLFIIAVGARFWGGVNYLEVPPVAPGAAEHGLGAYLILQGAVLTFFSFIGFEDILNVSEEVKNPRTAIPFGLIGAMAGATLIYMAVAITAVSVLPWQKLAASPAPLMEVAKTAAPWFRGIDHVFLVITLFSVGNTALLNFLMGSRLLYGMAGQRLLPAWLGKVHPRRHTPHLAILTLLGIVSCLILAGGVKTLAEATVLLLLGVFVMVNVSLLVLKRRPGEAHGGFEVPAIVPVLGAIVCVVLIVSRIHGAIASAKPDAHHAPLIAGAIFAASLVMFQFVKPRALDPEE